MEFYQKIPHQVPNNGKIVDFIELATARLPNIHEVNVGATGMMDIVLTRKDHGIETYNRVTVRFFDPAKNPDRKLSDAENDARTWQCRGVYIVPSVDGKRIVGNVQSRLAVEQALKSATEPKTTDAPAATPTEPKKRATGQKKGGRPAKSKPAPEAPEV